VGGERASEAGSRAAKPWYRWRARVRGPTSRKGRGAERALFDGRRPGSSTTPAFDEVGGKAVSAAGGASKGAEHVATRGVRGRCALSARGRQRRGTGGAPSRARRYRSPPGNQGRPQPPDRRGRERNRPKRVERRQARHGPACLLEFAPWGEPAAKAEGTTGNRAIVAGARDVGLVAEVGKEHLPRSRTRASKGVHGPAG